MKESLHFIIAVIFVLGVCSYISFSTSNSNLVTGHAVFDPVLIVGGGC